MARPRSTSNRLPDLGAAFSNYVNGLKKMPIGSCYVVKLRKAIYVLHAFIKKSKFGIELPKPDAELIEARLKRAYATDAGG